MRSSTTRFDSDLARQVATLAAILGGIAINTWSNLYPLNGINISELSNTRFAAVQITPANYAFAIWGLIYLGLIAFGLFQFQPAQRRNPRLQRSSWLLVMASIAQIAWIYLFLNRWFWLSVVAMVGILLPLMGMYLRLQRDRPLTRRERWLVDYPISIYFGWITVATVVNVALALYSIAWTGWGIGAEVWAAILMVISAAIAALTLWRHHDIPYPLVIIWALVAIAVRQSNVPLIVGMAIALVAGLILLLAWRLRAPRSVELHK